MAGRLGELRAEMARFIVVGGIAVGIDALVYVLLQRVFGFDPSLAKRVSFAIGAVWAFFANKYFTFGSANWLFVEPPMFVLVYAFGWLANTLMHDLIMGLTGFGWASFLAATGTSTLTNFVGLKFLVFRRTRLRQTS